MTLLAAASTSFPQGTALRIRPRCALPRPDVAFPLSAATKSQPSVGSDGTSAQFQQPDFVAALYNEAIAEGKINAFEGFVHHLYVLLIGLVLVLPLVPRGKVLKISHQVDLVRLRS